MIGKMKRLLYRTIQVYDSHFICLYELSHNNDHSIRTIHYTPRANCSKLFRMNGIETATVAADAVKAMEMAANGNASFSFAKAAVPNPWAAAPIPNPRATASRIPNPFNIMAPKLAPIKPVITTIETANEISPPNMVAIAMANGEVMFLDNNDNRK